MNTARRMHRHVRGVVADLVAEHGRLEVVHQRWEATPEEYDRYVSPFETYGAVGGAGVWTTSADDEVLLVRREGESVWLDPGGGIEQGENYRECAVRECEEETGLTPTITGLEQVRVFHVHDHTDRPPVPDVAVIYRGEASGDPRPEPGEIAATRWFPVDQPPSLAYDELQALFETE